MADVLFVDKPELVRKKGYTWGISAMVFHHIPEMQDTIDVLAAVTTKGIIVVDYSA